MQLRGANAPFDVCQLTDRLYSSQRCGQRHCSQLLGRVPCLALQDDIVAVVTIEILPRIKTIGVGAYHSADGPPVQPRQAYSLFVGVNPQFRFTGTEIGRGKYYSVFPQCLGHFHCFRGNGFELVQVGALYIDVNGIRAIITEIQHRGLTDVGHGVSQVDKQLVAQQRNHFRHIIGILRVDKCHGVYSTKRSKIVPSNGWLLIAIVVGFQPLYDDAAYLPFESIQINARWDRKVGLNGINPRFGQEVHLGHDCPAKEHRAAQYAHYPDRALSGTIGKFNHQIGDVLPTVLKSIGVDFFHRQSKRGGGQYGHSSDERKTDGGCQGYCQVFKQLALHSSHKQYGQEYGNTGQG